MPISVKIIEANNLEEALAKLFAAIKSEEAPKPQPRPTRTELEMMTESTVAAGLFGFSSVARVTGHFNGYGAPTYAEIETTFYNKPDDFPVTTLRSTVTTFDYPDNPDAYVEAVKRTAASHASDSRLLNRGVIFKDKVKDKDTVLPN